METPLDPPLPLPFPLPLWNWPLLGILFLGFCVVETLSVIRVWGVCTWSCFINVKSLWAIASSRSLSTLAVVCSSESSEGGLFLLSLFCLSLLATFVASSWAFVVAKMSFSLRAALGSVPFWISVPLLVLLLGLCKVF